MAAIVLCLMTAKIHDRPWLQAHSAKEHRGQLIRFIHGSTLEPEASLGLLTDAELVRWGFALRPGAANALGKWEALDD
jgi:hypothetical protein